MHTHTHNLHLLYVPLRAWMGWIWWDSSTGGLFHDGCTCYSTLSLHHGLRSGKCITAVEILYMHRGKSLPPLAAHVINRVSFCRLMKSGEREPCAGPNLSLPRQRRGMEAAAAGLKWSSAASGDLWDILLVETSVCRRSLTAQQGGCLLWGGVEHRLGKSPARTCW